MGTRTSIGAITISDIKDGFNPLSAVLSNQSHSFASNPAGVVSAGDISEFECEIFAYVGTTRSYYSTTGADNSYSISVLTKNAGSPADDVNETSTANGWTTKLITEGTGLNTHAKIITTGITSASSVSKLVYVTLTMVNSVGASTNVELVISLAKVIEGTGGAIVTLLPNRQTFSYTGTGALSSSGTGDIILGITTAGNVGGTLSAEYSIDGSTTFNAISASAGNTTLVAGGNNSVKALNLQDGGSLTISSVNFGTSNSIAIKVSGSAGGSDIISIIRVADGAVGKGAIAVFITSNTGGFAFHNNTGSTKTLTAKAYDADTGLEMTTGLTYAWSGPGTSSATTKTVQISPNNVPDGGSELYECTVVKTDA